MESKQKNYPDNTTTIRVTENGKYGAPFQHTRFKVIHDMIVVKKSNLREMVQDSFSSLSFHTQLTIQ